MPTDETQIDESASVNTTSEPNIEPPKDEPSEAKTPEIETPEEAIPEIQHSQPTAPEEPILEEPVIEPLAPPAPPEPKLQPIPEPPLTHHQSPVTDSPPPIAPTPPVVPRTTPPIAPTPSQITDKPVLRDTPVAPAKHDPKNTKGVPQRVLELTEEEINAARLLWAREHIAEAQAQGNRNRRARMNKRMDEIEAIIRAKPQTTTHVIATGMKLSDRTTSNYLQKLVKAGRIKASGNSRNRRYYI